MIKNEIGFWILQSIPFEAAKNQREENKNTWFRGNCFYSQIFKAFGNLDIYFRIILIKFFWTVIYIFEIILLKRTVKQVPSLRPAPLWKKRLWHKCFPVNFAKLIKPFLQNTSGGCFWGSKRAVAMSLHQVHWLRWFIVT